ncbi:MAG: hypothetical protein K0R64_2913 [Novosphingobium lindaniclasticum]|jgi:hypothetical protein|nr:hypothetical protein [Novosphingobium lindaniclasticum]
MGNRFAHMLLNRFHAQARPVRYLIVTIAVQAMREKYFPRPGRETGHGHLEPHEGIPRFKGGNGIEAFELIDGVTVKVAAASCSLALVVPDKVDRRLPQIGGWGGNLERSSPSSSGEPHKKLLDDIAGLLRRSMPSCEAHKPVAVGMIEVLKPIGIAADNAVLRRQRFAFTDRTCFRAAVLCPVQAHDRCPPRAIVADTSCETRTITLPIVMGFLQTEFIRSEPDEANVLKSSTGAFSHEGLDIHADGPDAIAPSDCFKRRLARLYADTQRKPDSTQVHSQCKL